MFDLLIAFIVAWCASLVLMPLARNVCRRVGLTDQPDGRRKLHEAPVALAGGIGVTLASLVALGILSVFQPADWQRLMADRGELAGLLLATVIILVVGIVDDRFGLRGRQKLFGQFVACLVIVSTGLSIQQVTLFGLTLQFGVLAIPLTVLFLLAAINAVNLLDGVNGLAASIGLINASVLAVLAYQSGHAGHALVAAVFAGSLLGFLRYNFPNATVFLGDAGSMLIGLFMGVVSIQSSLKGPGTVLLAAPVCLFAIPFFDTTAAIVRRKLTGRSIYTTDRGHLHHRLTERLGSVRAVLLIALACGISAAGALGSVSWENDHITFLVPAAVVGMFVATRLFGHTEIWLLARRMHDMGRTLVDVRPRKSHGTHSTVRLQGTREWDALWAGLVEAAREMPLTRIELDVNAPKMHEGYHASWRRANAGDEDRVWRFDFPLMADSSSAGRIRLTGDREFGTSVTDLEKLMHLLDNFEGQLGQILQTQPHSRPGELSIFDGDLTPKLSELTKSAGGTRPVGRNLLKEAVPAAESGN